jgi:cellulose synthase operon protein B
MTHIKPVFMRLATCAIIAAFSCGPVWAQLSPTPEDVPMINLDAVLDAPVGDLSPAVVPPTVRTLDIVVSEPVQPAETAPAPATAEPVVVVPEPQTPAFQNEIQDEALLTVPSFDRGGGGQTEEEAQAANLLLPFTAKRSTLDGIVRLTGEVQTETFYVDLPQAAAVQNLVVSYRTSINVLPDSSEMLITVNGVATPTLRPNAFAGFVGIDLPATLLTEGRNEITITLHHTHRIFCGPSATFDIWTEIDTNTSGVRVARGDLPNDPIGMVMALRAQLAMSGSLPVRLIDDIINGTASGNSNLDHSVLDALTPRLSGLRGGGPVILAPEKPYSVVKGMPQLARISVLYGPVPSVDIRRGGDGTAVLLLTLAYDGALPDLDGILPLPEPLQNNALLEPGKTTTLGQLGFSQPDAYNRYSEQQVVFRMPDDWLLLASQKGLLRLNYSFLDGLPKGALMLVKMNDATIQMLPLDIAGGKTQPTLEVGFRARLLRPGANVLTFATIVPGDPPDLPCPGMPAPMVSIGTDTTLIVPPSPRMQMSDLARPLIALRPDQIRAETTPVVGGGSTYFPAILAAALRPIAQTERLPDASLNITLEGTDESLNLNDLGVNRRDLLRLFAVPSPAELAQEAAAAKEAEQKRFHQAIVYVKAVATEIRQLAIPDDGTLLRWLDGRRAQAVLFIPRDDAPEAVWLMVKPDSNPQFLAATLAQARLLPVGPRGRLAILTDEGKWESWHSSSPAPILLDKLSFANIRTVAGNYASWSPLFYGTILLVLTLISVGFAFVYIITTRGNRKR